MKKIYLISTIVLAVAAITFSLGAKLFWSNQGNNTYMPPEDKKGIVVVTPQEDQVVSSPLKIEGYVNGEGWIAFEGQVGTVKLFDSNGNELGMGILIAKGEWMQVKVDFETTIWFDYPGDGTGKLVFYNENPSGEEERNKTYELPVKLSKSSSEKTTFNIYFSQQHVADCDEVFSYKREIPKTQTIATAAVGELLKGPTDSEIYAGAFTSINEGVQIKNLVIENSVAKVDFSAELDRNVAGSCKVLAIRSQIEKTLLQFPTVKSVVISVDGRVEDILQP